MTDQQTLQKRYDAVSSLLRDHYGHPQWRPHLEPVAELVSTILSQSTTDHNRDMAYDSLQAQYPTWEAVRDAPVSAIEKAIRSAGLAKQKAPRIKNALQYITKTRGKIELDFLRELPTEDALAWLMHLDGIGRKTASIILLFCFEMPVYPVDTHVHRVTKRLGFHNTNAEKAHKIMESIANPEHFYADHLNIIRHGRQVCQARNPLCESCFLRHHCLFYQSEKRV